MYDADVAVATYPGTVSPLRGLDPFGESERDVWHGREAERDELARLVTADGFRAGLLYGEQGVGKTSLLRAGLIPHLRDHGVVALACEDLFAPTASFAAGLAAFGINPTSGEQPLAFAIRAVSNAVAGQQFVFVVDDVDLACVDERVIGELSMMFAQVVSRSAGRARFLFACASERMHVLGALERRTGSLFPPSNRYELARLPQPQAAAILDRVLSLSGLVADPAFAHTVVEGLARGGTLLAADLQIAAMALRDLRITTPGALQQAGGPRELESAWLHAACAATGNERSALRMCAELADGGAGPHPAEAVIRRINLDGTYAQQAFATLESRGVIARGDHAGTTWLLRHEVLTQRVRELTAPARAAARRVFELLGSKTQSRGRLTLRELYALRSEGIAPVTPAEIDVVQRSKRHYVTIAGVAAAVPIIILISMIVSMRGHAFFDLEPRPGGAHVVVLGGRAGLASFGWLPASGFGKELADTGLTRAMVAPEAWKKIEAHGLGGSRGGWSDDLTSIMAPQLAGLVAYAKTGSDQALGALAKAAHEPDDLAELLSALRPIARGGPAEVQLVEQAVRKGSPAVQRAAVAAAGAAAQRRPDAYKDTLIQALTSSDGDLRRIAFAAVRNLGERGRLLFEAALAANPGPDARRELLAEVSAASAEGAPPLSDAVAVLADSTASAPMRDRARAQLEAALERDPEHAAAALVTLVGDDHAPSKARTFAIGALADLDPLPKSDALGAAARAAYTSRSDEIRAAALPLYAKVDPVRAGGDLATMLDDKQLARPLRVAAALAWGQVASSDRDAATRAIDTLLKDPDDDVRAAAATAAGMFGRAYQDKLVKLAKIESYKVRIGAADGLAETALTGGSVGVGIDGIAQLYKEKGRLRREAVRIYAHLASKKPGSVVGFLAAAAHVTDDPELHPVAVGGLCNAAHAGNNDARYDLARIADDPAVEVRRLVMQCFADEPEPGKLGSQVAGKLSHDPDNEIRASAARVLATAAAKGKGGSVGDQLVQLLDDPDRDVRATAIRAVGALGTDAPKTASAALAKLFERGDEAEKLALIHTATQIGASDLITAAVADAAPRVRIAAVDAALATGLAGAPIAALADQDPQVRRAALEHLAAHKDKVPAELLARGLALAARDPDPELRQIALTTIARVAPEDAVVARLRRALDSRVEGERAQAAAAAIGLVDRDANKTVELLEPLLDDASHDVRVALVPALAAAYAKTNAPDKLGQLLAGSETHAMRRLVIAAAFVTLARTDSGAAAVKPVLDRIASSGPPMARQLASLVSGMIAAKVDGLAFLQELVP